MEWLKRGQDQRCFDSLFVRDDARFRHMYADVRFQSFLAQQLRGINPDAGSSV